MSVYMTEEEQVEAIKQWFKRYGNLVIVLLSAIFLGIGIYKYWYWHKQKVNAQASNTYESMMLAVSEYDEKKTQLYAQQLINNVANTVYGDAAYLALAKLYTTQREYSKSLVALEYVVNHSSIPAFKDLALVRMARIYSEQKKYSKALALLSPLGDSIYQPVINELKGDLYAGQKNYQKSRESYQVALNAVRSRGIENLFLEMKLNQVSSLIK